MKENKVKQEWDVDDLIYRGVNENAKASDDTYDWEITKNVYVAGALTESTVRITSWTNRATGW